MGIVVLIWAPLGFPTSIEKVKQKKPVEKALCKRSFN